MAASSRDAVATLGTNFTTCSSFMMRARNALFLSPITMEHTEVHLSGTVRQRRCLMCAILSSASAAAYGQLLSLHAASGNTIRGIGMKQTAYMVL